MLILKKIAAHIAEITNQPFEIKNYHAIGGGCINRAFQLDGGDLNYFVKLNEASQQSMFVAEFAGLKAMQNTHTIRVPEPICHGVFDQDAYIVLEHINFGRGDHHSLAKCGQQLAALHQSTQAQFGWHMDNTIGSTLQKNNLTSDWVNFWAHYRLHFQLELAAKNGHRGALQRKGDKLLVDLGAFFSNYQPQPALLHGDLWSGNYAADEQDQPVIFDPAVYYGDREADIAMTELFGGFGTSFYQAYQDVSPLDDGYSTRKILYNLYHILNHLNLFGGGYHQQAEDMLDRLLTEIR